ncbi:MAG: UDP-N-acetylmuramate dehydrogenase [Arenicella sp.]
MISLKELHTFGFDSLAESLIEIVHRDQLVPTFRTLKGQQYYLLGEGSNSVFLEDYLGTIVLNKLSGIQRHQDDAFFYLSVASGEPWHELVKSTLSMGIYGFENLALIPGTVGAAPIQNIGAYGVEIGTFIESVEYFDIDSSSFILISGDDCKFKYRDSIFKNALFQKAVITQVNFKLPKKNVVEQTYAPLNQLTDPSPLDIFNEVVKVRSEKLPDPKKLGNAGSFYKNPIVTIKQFEKIQTRYESVPHFRVDKTNVKIPAAWLIDQLGYKGKSCLGVKCHERQPLVLVNEGNGNGKGLLMLARKIKLDVSQNFSIDLENEVRLVGNNGLVNL